MPTYHGIAKAIRLCCTEGGVITDVTTLEIMNDAPGGVDCPRCRKHDILWEMADGKRAITREDLPLEGDTRFFTVEEVPAP